MNFAFYCFLAYIFMLPLEYYQEKIPKGPTGINYRTLTLIGLTLFWLYYRANRKRIPMLRSPLNPVVATYLFVVLFGSLLASFSYPEIEPVWDPGGRTFKWYLGVVNGIVIFWAAGALLDTHKKMRYALLALCASTPIVFRAFYNSFSSARSFHFDDDMRASLPFVTAGSNELGAFLVVCAIVMMVWAFAKIRVWERLAFLTGFSFYVYAIMYSFSRGSQLGFGVALAVLAILRHRWMLILMLIAAFTMNLWLPVSVRERWENTKDADGKLEKSAESREVFWALARELFAESPVFGHGVGTFKVINPAKMDTHNLYWRTLAEQGLIGGVVLMSMWFLVLKMSLSVWRKAEDPNDRQIGLGLFAATLGLMICNIFGDRFTYLQLIGQFWLVAGIVARLYAKQRGWEGMADDTMLQPAPALLPDANGRKSRTPLAPALAAPARSRFLIETQVAAPQTVVPGTLSGPGEAAPRVLNGSEAPRNLVQAGSPASAQPLILGAERPADPQVSGAPREPELKIAGRREPAALRLINPRPEPR